MPTQAQVVDSQVFCKDCEKFLTSLVLSFQKQSGDVAALASKVQALSIGLANSVSPPVPGPSMSASLQQSLVAGVPAGNPGAFPQRQGGGTGTHNSSSGSSAATIQAAQATTIAALEQKVNLLEAKFAQLSSHSASTTGSSSEGQDSPVPEMSSRSFKRRCPHLTSNALEIQLFSSNRFRVMSATIL
jgi:hypothetical protein